MNDEELAARPCVAVGMSGGVDSTMAALLLQGQGYEVIGLTMQVWGGDQDWPDEGRSGCYGPGEVRDIAKTKELARRLGIKHYVVPLVGEYKKGVLDYCRSEYSCGRTPNPCVKCNRELKFGLLWQRAHEMGIQFDCFATGHYARVEYDRERRRMLLRRAVDLTKDQSYFLARLSQEQLKLILFPLGGMTKAEVKKLAAAKGCSDLAEQEESQDFLESKDYSVLFGADRDKPGLIVDQDGKILGEHQGVMHYTIGQRKGLKLGGRQEPLFVVALDSERNLVVVGPKNSLFSDGLLATDANWIALESAPHEPLAVKAKIRRQHQEVDAKLVAEGPEQIRLQFAEPQLSVTPGQAVVFYDGDIVLGSGIIEKALP